MLVMEQVWNAFVRPRRGTEHHCANLQSSVDASIVVLPMLPCRSNTKRGTSSSTWPLCRGAWCTDDRSGAPRASQLPATPSLESLPHLAIVHQQWTKTSL